MDHQAKYQTATMDTQRESELRIQALGAAISRRDWHATERAYESIRDKFYESEKASASSDAAARPQAAIANLDNHQVQCDKDGVMIQVSRQALDEVLTYLAATPSRLKEISNGNS